MKSNDMALKWKMKYNELTSKWEMKSNELASDGKMYSICGVCIGVVLNLFLKDSGYSLLLCIITGMALGSK